MRLIVSLLLVIWLSLPAAAQEFAPRFETIGTINLTVGTVEHELAILYDREIDWAYATEKELFGNRAVYVLAGTAGLDGMPGPPMLRLIFFSNVGVLLSAVFVDERGLDAPLAAGDMSPLGFTAFNITDDSAIEATFVGEFLRMNDDMAMSVEEGAEPVPFEGTMVVSAPRPE